MSKVIAIIEEPVSCSHCWFNACKWSTPFWSKNKELRNTRGYFCQLIPKEQRRVIKVPWEIANTWKFEDCPLKPYEECEKK